MRQQALDLAPERQRICEVHDAYCTPAHFVLVGRADAAPRGADAGEQVGGLANGVELLVQGQDQRGILGNAQVLRRDIDPLPPQPVDLLEERVRIDHDAVADHGQLPRPHHARRQERQLVGDPVDDERVARIMSTLEANDDVGLLRQPVDDFPLSLVPPLGTDHDHIGHEAPFLRVADARDSLAATKACPTFGGSTGKGSGPCRQGGGPGTGVPVLTPTA